MRTKHLLLALAATLTIGITSLAVPVKPGTWRTLRLVDGTEIRAELRGDEHCRYWLAENGTAYTMNKDGRYISTDFQTLIEHGNNQRALANARRVKRAAGQSDKYTGKKRGLIILVEFSGKASDDIPAKSFTIENAQAYYDRVANEAGFNDPEKGFKSSIYDYFYSQSEGQFEFNFDVVGPFKLPNTYRTYGENDGMGIESNVGKLIYDACRYADIRGNVDFSQYDWDGDGNVDQVFVLYAGQGENTCPEDPYLIWPQEGSLGSLGMSQQPFRLDGVTISDFACSCELGEDAKIDGIGTICHEFSHCFGLPDMYDKGTSFGSTSLNYGTYVWDLMNMGNYLDNGFQPAGFTAYERMFCGWKNLIELTENTEIQAMRPLSEGGDAYLIRNDAHPDEYYILENRQQVGCDAGLYTSGLLVSHVDYDAEVWSRNDVNTGKERFGIFAADNSWERIESDIKGDLYPFNGNNALTAMTSPAAILNHKNTDGTMFMHKDVTDIIQNTDGTISFRFTNQLASGIEDILSGEDKPASPMIYHINGQRITAPWKVLPSGVYIVNGTRVVK